MTQRHLHEMGCSLQIWLPCWLLALVQFPQFLPFQVQEVLGFCPETPSDGGRTKVVSVVSFPFGSQGVTFSALCSVLFHCFDGTTCRTVRTLCMVPCPTPVTHPLQCPYLTRCLHTRQCQLCHAVYQAFETKQFHQIHTVQSDSPISISENRKFDHLHASCSDSVKTVSVCQSMGKCNHWK